MQEMLKLPNWILWKKVTRKGKETKMPITITGEPASINKHKYTSTEAIAAYLGGFGNGVGIIIQPNDAEPNKNIVGIDIDNCRQPDGELSPLAHEVVTRMNSYTEISQSGNGIHILIRANYPHGKRLEGIEVYGKGRFLVTTFDHLPGTPTDILPRQEELTALLAKFRQPTKKRTTTHTATQATLAVPGIVVR